jgi:hypothetical protein
MHLNMAYFSHNLSHRDELTWKSERGVLILPVKRPPSSEELTQALERYGFAEKAEFHVTVINPEVGRIINVLDIKPFYAEREDLTDASLTRLFPHITLFTTGTDENTAYHGIGIASREAFEELSTEHLSVS